jgi:hypothetical protein
MTVRFADAVERGDIDGIVALLTNDAWVTMRPSRTSAMAETLSLPSSATVPPCAAATSGSCHRANGQPAFGCYLPDAHSEIEHC